MKRILSLFLALVSIFILSGCDSSYEISGLENFSENICSMGTCDKLLPGDKTFLSSYDYEDGKFYYWTDGDYSQAKAFVQLQYSKEIYHYLKSICENHYYFSSTQYKYEEFLFSTPKVMHKGAGSVPASGIQMFGYDDATCTLLFISCYGYEFDRSETITPSLFSEFFRSEFGGYLRAENQEIDKIGDSSLS